MTLRCVLLGFTLGAFVLHEAPAAPEFPQRSAKKHGVDQRDKTFRPSALRIAQGDSLVFMNSDDVTHNVFSTSDGFKFNVGKQAPGASRSIAFARRGTAIIRCAFHPTMRMKVVVE